MHLKDKTWHIKPHMYIAPILDTCVTFDIFSLVCYQGSLCQIFIKIEVRDPEILDPEKRKNRDFCRK